MNRDDESNLLNLLRDIESLEHEFRDTKAQKFNIFEAVGFERQEIRHSKALAFFLNPNEPHGLGDSLFKKFICNKEVSDAYQNLNLPWSPSPVRMALGDFDDLLVRREDMRIDILMWSLNNKIVVAIENKVGAKEGENQLPSYTQKIINDSRFMNFKKLFIYLTAEGEDGSDMAWIPISYKLIADSLEEILIDKVNLISEECKLFITNYIDLIRKHVMKEIDVDYINACQILYEKHKVVFDTIYENIVLDTDSNEAIEAIKSFLLENDVKLNYSNGRWLSFIPTRLDNQMPIVNLQRPWQKQNKPLVFFFELMKDQIKLVVEVGPVVDLDLRNRLVLALNNSINGMSKVAKSNTYTRIWSKSEKYLPKAESEYISSEEIRNIMNNLYSQLKYSKVIENAEYALKSIFSDATTE